MVFVQAFLKRLTVIKQLGDLDDRAGTLNPLFHDESSAFHIRVN